MFAVLRAWHRDDSRPLIRSFWTGMVSEFAISMRFGAISALFWGFIAADLLVVPMLPAGADIVVRAALIAVAIAGLATTVYVFPMIVGYRMPLARVIRSSLLLGVGSPATTLGCLGILTLAGGVVYLFPPSIVLIAPLTASTLLRMTARAFTRIEATSAATTSSGTTSSGTTSSVTTSSGTTSSVTTSGQGA